MIDLRIASLFFYNPGNLKHWTPITVNGKTAYFRIIFVPTFSFFKKSSISNKRQFLKIVYNVKVLFYRLGSRNSYSEQSCCYDAGYITAQEKTLIKIKGELEYVNSVLLVIDFQKQRIKIDY